MGALRSNKKILYALVAALLISACVSVSLAGEATYDSMMLQSLSTSAAETPGSEGNETFLLDEWKREIIIDAWGGISGSDYYLIFNNQSEDLYRITFWLPVNASGISVQDAYGEYPKTSIVTSIWEDHIELTVMLRAPLRTGERNEFLISYRLPPDLYIIQNSWQDYTLKLNLSKPENWFVKKFKISILLPEGAVIKSVSNEPYKVEKQGLSIKITMEEIDLEDFLHPQISLEYQYFIIWGAARPAIWAAIAGLVGAAFFYIWRFFRPEAAVTPLPVSTLRGFVEAYEEKRRLLGKIESLERQFRRGRVSRKRFRLRRRSLEQRLSSLNRRLVELRGQIAAASRRYEEMMREIETAEAEIETLNVDIEHVETRYRRGEISADVHRRLLAEYSRIKERAENRISEILLRLEEGI